MIQIEIPYRKPEVHHKRNGKKWLDPFNGLPVSTNRWRHLHWAIQNRLKENWHYHMKQYILEKNIKVKKITPPVKMEIIIYKVGSKYDISRVYIDDIQDFFVRDGFIEDDNSKILMQPIVRFEQVKTRLEQRTIIQIYSIGGKDESV